ncbi:hypothetical protein B0H17DRAFT_455089 [Mycena rosella]|uniref:Cytochrome P450 n=1 Tax=Mycena rosella TaxID=1033263 RepID=A0AAD7MAS4_MYCRO|nr:hypothetical protein B0H17DRAFT_455089 [Mycena rosella]
MLKETGFLALCLFTVTIIWVSRRLRSSRRPIAIPGPKPTSWFYGTRHLLQRCTRLIFPGNIYQLFRSKEYGEHEFQWQEMYGPVYSVKGWFGTSRLMISDPLTAKFVLNSRVFVPGPSMEKGINILFGDECSDCSPNDQGDR